MNKLYKTEEIVEKVLREYEDTRNDNFILIYRFIEKSMRI